MPKIANTHLPHTKIGFYKTLIVFENHRKVSFWSKKVWKFFFKYKREQRLNKSLKNEFWTTKNFDNLEFENLRILKI